MATEAKPGIYKIDIPLADSQTLFTKAIKDIPHSPCYGELVFNTKGRERCLKNCTMDLIYSGSGTSFNLWFTDPAIDNTKALEHQNQNGEVTVIIEKAEADQIRLNLGLAVRTNPLIYDDFRNNLLPQLQEAGYLIYSADLRLPSEHLEKAFSESYMGNGLKLITKTDKASVCLTLSHHSNMSDDQKTALETWFAKLQ